MSGRGEEPTERLRHAGIPLPATLKQLSLPLLVHCRQCHLVYLWFNLFLFHLVCSSTFLLTCCVIYWFNTNKTRPFYRPIYVSSLTFYLNKFSSNYSVILLLVIIGQVDAFPGKYSLCKIIKIPSWHNKAVPVGRSSLKSSARASLLQLHYTLGWNVHRS